MTMNVWLDSCRAAQQVLQVLQLATLASTMIYASLAAVCCLTHKTRSSYQSMHA
jgi:hypothetical protein